MEWRIPRLREIYKSRLCSFNQAIRRVKPGGRMFIGTGCAEPQYLVDNLVNHPRHVADVEIIHLVSLRPNPPYADPQYRRMFRLNTFFIGSKATRDAVGRGDADYTPIFLSEIPKLINTERLHIDVALVQVSPPDTFGNWKLNVPSAFTLAAVRAATF